MDDLATEYHMEYCKFILDWVNQMVFIEKLITLVMVEQKSFLKYKLYFNIYAWKEQRRPDHLLKQWFLAFFESPLEI